MRVICFIVTTGCHALKSQLYMPTGKMSPTSGHLHRGQSGKWLQSSFCVRCEETVHIYLQIENKPSVCSLFLQHFSNYLLCGEVCGLSGLLAEVQTFRHSDSTANWDQGTPDSWMTKFLNAVIAPIFSYSFSSTHTCFLRLWWWQTSGRAQTVHKAEILEKIIPQRKRSESWHHHVPPPSLSPLWLSCLPLCVYFPRMLLLLFKELHFNPGLR